VKKDAMPESSLSLAIEAHRRRERRLGRRLRAVMRHTIVIFREFSGILTLFVVTLLGAALLFMILWNRFTPFDPLNFDGALYHVITLVFFQPTIDFPAQWWYLEVFFFFMPALGIIFLTLGVADFAQLLFQRNTNQQAWEEAMASTYQDHIIIAGVGHLGIRVVRELILLDEDVVVIEQDPDNHRLEEVRSYDVPVIIGDARNGETLMRAGLDKAASLIIATNDDLANLQIASRVRETNKTIRLVMRLFDDDFARMMAERFDVAAVMSASMMAAPAFAGAATGTEITQTFKMGGKVLVMGRLEIQPRSRLDGGHVSDIGTDLDISVVLLEADGEVDVHPQPERMLHAGNMIAVVAELHKIQHLALEWNKPMRL
jgi:voltage-gated potassium channel